MESTPDGGHDRLGTASGARSRVAEIANAALRGAASGVLGAAAMAAASKLEQLATGPA
jgi:hypothetical protein